MTAFRIIREDTAFSKSRERKPRQTDEAHLKALRFLPCVVCLSRPVDAAHIRTASRIHGKRETGAGEKPSDKWCLPLCRKHHDRQHAMSEGAFWDRYGIDPFGTALALWAAEGDAEAMELIVRIARQSRPFQRRMET